MSRRSARDIETEHGFARRATAFCLRLTVVCLLRSLPLLLIFGGVAYGAVSLWQAGIADERFMIRGDTLSLSLPSRLSAEAVYKIEELGKFPRPRSILDPFLLTDLRAKYEANPWVRQVCQLKRVYPDRLAVEFVLRMPVAQVKSYITPERCFYWQVDDTGMQLPLTSSSQPVPGLVVVEGSTRNALSRHPGAGASWNDRGVKDALGILQTLRASPVSEDLHVKRVIVHTEVYRDVASNLHSRRPRLDIETDEGVLVRWGTFNGGDLPDEVLNAEKVAMLQNLVNRDLAKIPGICLDIRTRVPGFQFQKQ